MKRKLNYLCSVGFVLFATSIFAQDALGLGESSLQPGYSCKQILLASGAPNGVYWIDPDGLGGNVAFEVYCDMTTAGGGWMLAVNSLSSSEAASTDMVANTGTVSPTTGHTRNLAYFAIDQTAEIRHYINYSGTQTHHAKYTGKYHNPLPPESSWINFPGHTVNYLTQHYGMAWQTAGNGFNSFGAPWYYYVSNPYSFVIPAKPVDGQTQGPVQTTNLIMNQYSIYVRELPYPNVPPIAIMDGPYYFAISAKNNGITFDASASQDPNQGQGDMIVYYEWDLNNDLIFEKSTSAQTISLTPAEVATLFPANMHDYQITLRVRDLNGGTNQVSTYIRFDDSLADSDGDGVPDASDGCPSDPDKAGPGQCGCSVADSDSDLDGVADCLDGCPDDINKIEAGICGCGISDVDSDGDGAANCLDNCPADASKTEPGVCGCGVADGDIDSDGTADCVDGCPSNSAKTVPGFGGCSATEVDVEPASEVTVNPAAEVAVTLTDVTGACTLASDLTSVDMPIGYQAVGDIYDISTNCSLITATVCLTYDETKVHIDELDLKLFHYNSGLWEDITTSVDEVNNTVCGETTSFSPFVVGELIGDVHVLPALSALSSLDTDLVVTFDASRSTCYDLAYDVLGVAYPVELSCEYSWEFGDGGTGLAVGGNGDDEVVYQYDAPGTYTATLTMTEPISGVTASKTVTSTAALIQPQGGYADFATAVNGNTVTLTAPTLDTSVVRAYIYWGDRKRTVSIHAQADFAAGISYTYGRGGRDYNIRVQTIDAVHHLLDYTFSEDGDLTVTLP